MLRLQSEANASQVVRFGFPGKKLDVGHETRSILVPTLTFYLPFALRDTMRVSQHHGSVGALGTIFADQLAQSLVCGHHAKDVYSSPGHANI